MKKIVFTFFVSCFMLQAFGQFSSLEKIDDSIQKYTTNIGGYNKVRVEIADFLNMEWEKIPVYIYTYGCGELNCIKAFVNIDGRYEEILYDVYSSYSLGSDKRLHLSEHECCGESPFSSNKTYKFVGTSVVLEENYIETNIDYTDNQFLTPPNRVKPYFVRVLNDNYNLRFSPTIERVETFDDIVFTCEETTNIIAKIKADAIVKVLGKYETKERTWLYVEVENQSIKDRCKVTDFGDFKSNSFPLETYHEQKIRGWISSNFVEKQ